MDVQVFGSEVNGLTDSDATALSNSQQTPDADRFATIYRAFHGEVLRFISRRLLPPDHARAEDITHDTFMVAMRRLTELPTDSNQLKAWLFVTARNCLANDKRLGYRYGEGVRIADEAIGFHPAAVDQIGASGLKVDLATAWLQLTPTEQEVIALTAWDGLTSIEAGQVMGISDRAYRKRLHQARQKLRHQLAVQGKLQ